MEKRRGAMAKARLAVEPIAKAALAAAPLTHASAGVLIAEGDSWFNYPFHDVLSDLEDSFGFDVESVAHRGDTVEDMTERADAAMLKVKAEHHAARVR